MKFKIEEAYGGQKRKEELKAFSFHELNLLTAMRGVIV
jgi:hypothetical protein